MKKLLIVLCLSLGIVGCGDDKSSDTENNVTDSEITEVAPNTIVLEAPDIDVDSVIESESSSEIEPSSESESSDKSDIVYDSSGLNRILSLLGKPFKDYIQISELSEYSLENMKGADIDSEPYVVPYGEYEFSFDGDGVDFKCLNLTHNYEKIVNLDIMYATLDMQYVDKYLNLDIDTENRKELQNSIKDLFGSPIGSCTITREDILNNAPFFTDLLGYTFAESADINVYSKDDIIIFHTYSVVPYPESHGQLTFIYKPYLKQVLRDNVLSTLGLSNDASIMDMVKPIEKVSPEDSVTHYDIRYYDKIINVDTDKVETDVVAYPLSDGTYCAPDIFMFKFRYTSDFSTRYSMVLRGMHESDLEDYEKVTTIDGATLYCEIDDYFDPEHDEYKVYIASIDGVWVDFDEDEDDEYIESNFSSFVKGFRESMIVK